MLGPEGMQRLQTLRTRYSQAPELRALLREVYLARQDFTALAELMLEARPQTAADSLELARVLCKDQRFEAAAPVLAGLLAQGPPGAELRWLAAYTAFHRGQQQQAAALLDGGWQELLGQGHDGALLLRGLLHCYHGEHARAEALLREGLARQPDDIGAANALARVIAAQGRAAEAAEWFARVDALQTQGKERQRRFNQINDALRSLDLAWQERDFASGERHARTALQLGGPAVQRNAWLWLVQIYRAQGREAEARAAEEQAQALAGGAP